MTRLFLIEEYKRNLTFLVEISANTFITQYEKHLNKLKKKHSHKQIKSLHNNGKGHIKLAIRFYSILYV